MAILTEIQEEEAYDVFLSFRGKDTRLSFVDHLYQALINENISTFLDEEEVETGEELKPELERAIEGSCASIIVLSENYASSTWCLDELVKILEQKKRPESKHIVLPIFYHVEPTHVRKQESSFGVALTIHKQRVDAEKDQEKKSQDAHKLELWKKALTEVADLKGKDANGRRETVLIDEIVKEISYRLDLHLRSKIPHLIGMNNSISTISSWLTHKSSETADILTIWGMAGIGKTSLAEYIYKSNYHEFERSSFLEGIERKCAEQSSALFNLQKQLLGDLLKKKGIIEVCDVKAGTAKIMNVLLKKKTLVVLDGIDKSEQLDVLIGTSDSIVGYANLVHFHPGTKIIVTSKVGSVTAKCALFRTSSPPKHTIHKLSFLTFPESLRLFCRHAFGGDSPKEGYEQEAERVAKYCGGHPLALKVLGSALFNEYIYRWCDIKNMSETKDIFTDIEKVLKISFDSLPSDVCKELFKHIACFFVGEDKDIIEATLTEHGVCASYWISMLIDRCFLTIGNRNELKMHKLIQDMGRDLVCRESCVELSRYWNHKECFNLLKQNKGTSNVQGLFFDMNILETEQLGGSGSFTKHTFQDDLKKNFRMFSSSRCKNVELRTNALGRMINLKLLQLNHVKLNGSYKNFPKGLRWLRMHGFRKKYIPSELPMENLVTLDMSHSDLNQLWKKPKRLESLKFLNLSYCKFVKVGGFSELPSLERLVLVGCVSLIQVCESIGGCDRLVLLDLSYCKKLKQIPSSILELKKLRILSISCCFGDSKLLPRSQKSFWLSLPASLVKLSLANNKLFDKSFPMDFSSLPMLKELILDGNPIHSLPACVRSLYKLERLYVNGCLMLKSVLYPPTALKYLYTEDCMSLRKITFDHEISRPPVVFCQGAKSNYEIEGVIEFQDLTKVNEVILHALGWTNLQYVKDQKVLIDHTPSLISEMRLPVQICYEFGIFSTCYVGKEVPSWLAHKSNGSSISLTMPSPPTNKTIQGLNICFVHTPLRIRAHSYLLVKVRNKTKNCTWIYIRMGTVVVEGEEDIVWLSHWMFGNNELENGDEIWVTIFDSAEDGVVIKECAINLMYIDRDVEEDPLSKYKLWKHRIGGDVCDFQLTSGDYFLFHLRSITRLMPHLLQDVMLFEDSYKIVPFIGYIPTYKKMDGMEI